MMHDFDDQEEREELKRHALAYLKFLLCVVAAIAIGAAASSLIVNQ